MDEEDRLLRARLAGVRLAHVRLAPFLRRRNRHRITLFPQHVPDGSLEVAPALDVPGTTVTRPPFTLPFRGIRLIQQFAGRRFEVIHHSLWLSGGLNDDVSV